jgi:hypothetical protein
MKRFVKKIVLFNLPMLVILGIIFFIKTDREFCYNYIKGDCEQRGQSLYKKMYEERNKVDYLFVGSSKTWNNIDDGLLESLINTPDQYHLKLFNTGYCRFGRNLDYLFCKEFVKRNRIKKIFLEVRADESTTSHPIFPFLASGKEVLEGTLALNGKLFPEMYDHLLMNINYTRRKSDLEKTEINTSSPPRHGYNNIDKVIEPELLDEYYSKEKNKAPEVNKNSPEYRFSNYYIKKIKELCDKKQIELVFIFLPSYGNTTKIPAFKEEYEKMGKVIIAPDSLFTVKTYWKDVAHLNTFGATAYTKFLATELKR